jgi:hypothetical protein
MMLNTTVSRSVPSRQPLVMSQDAILLRAEAGDRLARSEIEDARAELDGDAIERFEGVRQQEQLRLRVERRALDALRRTTCARSPGGGAEVHVEIASGSDDVAARRLAHDERHCTQVLAHRERRVDPVQRLVRSGDARVPQMPKLAVGGRVLEPGLVLARERLEHHVRAPQRHRFDECHARIYSAATARYARGTRRARRDARPARS